MGEKKFTLMELHLDGDTQFGPRALPDLIAGTNEADADTAAAGSSPEAESAGEESGRGVGPLVAGLIAMVAIAVAVRRYRRDDAVEDETFDEQDVVVN